jgi:hypothetical protein
MISKTSLDSKIAMKDGQCIASLTKYRQEHFVLTKHGNDTHDSVPTLDLEGKAKKPERKDCFLSSLALIFSSLVDP